MRVSQVDGHLGGARALEHPALGGTRERDDAWAAQPLRLHRLARECAQRLRHVRAATRQARARRERWQGRRGALRLLQVLRGDSGRVGRGGGGIEVERGRAKVAAARRAPAGWAAAGPHTCSSDRGFLPAPTPRSPAAPPRSRRAASCARASRPRYTARNPSPAAAAARASSETPGAPRSRAAHVERSAWDRSAQGA